MNYYAQKWGGRVCLGLRLKNYTGRVRQKKNVEDRNSGVILLFMLPFPVLPKRSFTVFKK